jgi:CRP/FNR family transcriptional regulator
MTPALHASGCMNPKKPKDSRIELLPCDFCPGQATNICKPLERGRLAELLAIGTRQKWSKGEHLFRNGDRIKSIFKITKGVVALSQLLADGRRQILNFAQAGDLCGTLEVDGRYVVAARAVTDVEACAFDRDRFDAFVERHADVAAERRLALQDKLSFMAQRVTVLGRMLAHEKLAHFLIEYGAACAQRGLPVQPLTLPMTRIDIADYLGLTVETVCRTFADLRRQRLIQTIDNAVLILNRRRLEELGSASLVRVHDDAVALPVNVRNRPVMPNKARRPPVRGAASLSH